MITLYRILNDLSEVQVGRYAGSVGNTRAMENILRLHAKQLYGYEESDWTFVPDTTLAGKHVLALRAHHGEVVEARGEEQMDRIARISGQARCQHTCDGLAQCRNVARPGSNDCGEHLTLDLDAQVLAEQ